MMTTRNPQILVIVLSALFLSGCRLYGGYGTVEATQDAIRAETTRASEALESAARTLRSLDKAARSDERLAPVAADYLAVYDIHGQLVATYEERLDEFASSGSYRTVSRRLGAMLTEQRQIREAYQSLTETAAVIVAPERVPGIGVPGGMYGVYPAVYYARWHSVRTNAVDQVIRSAGSGS